MLVAILSTTTHQYRFVRHSSWLWVNRDGSPLVRSQEPPAPSSRKDTGRHEDADALRKELAEIRNQAETLLYTTEAALEGYANLVEPAMLEDTRVLAVELRGLLENQAELSEIRDAYQKLEATTFAIAETVCADVANTLSPTMTSATRS